MTPMPKKQAKSALHEWVESIVIALVLAIVIRSYIIQPFKIPSGSMRMSVIEGDYLFVDKWSYGTQILQPMFWDIGPQDGPPVISLRWPNSWLPLTKVRL